MTKTGQQRYPEASTSYWYQDNYPGSAMESNVGVVHTTEGMSLPSYGGGSSAPNFTALPDMKNHRLRFYQHFDFDVSSRALMNRSGGVETNTLNAMQLELVGTCDPKHRTSWGSRRAGIDYIFWPDAPDWALAELGKFVRWCHDEHGIKMRSTVRWTPYPESYGGGSYRLSGGEWRGYYGWLGHQHVPENDHGDPGNINFSRVLEYARGEAQKEDEMSYDSVMRHDGKMRSAWGIGTDNETWMAESVIEHIGYGVHGLEQQMPKLLAKLDALTETVKVLASREQVDGDAILEMIREKIDSIEVDLIVHDPRSAASE